LRKDEKKNTDGIQKMPTPINVRIENCFETIDIQEGLRHWVVGEGVAQENLSPERRLNGRGSH
jgi:hypothetical protein